MKNYSAGKKVGSGTIHKLPTDFRTALTSDPKVLSAWEDITPLARNEWICWVTSGKKVETRGIRINKALSKLRGGMRRPCCWAGCIHRSGKKTTAEVFASARSNNNRFLK